MENVKPDVAVWMVTFNQENYIAEAIDSVLNQITDFSLKLFIGEDCSTDSTGDVCQQYADTFSTKIFLIRNRKNLGPSANARQIYQACLSSKSKYIAMLEGDDYWIDPYKLQRQINFLNENENIALHGTKVLKLIDSNFADDGIEYSSVLCLNNLLKSNPYATASVMFRGDLIRNNLDYLFNSPFGDWALYWIILKANDYKDVLYLDSNVTAVYRKHDGGIHSGLSSINRNKKFIRFYRLLNDFTERKFEEEIVGLIKFRKEKLWNAQKEYVVKRAKLIFNKIGLTKSVN